MTSIGMKMAHFLVCIVGHSLFGSLADVKESLYSMSAKEEMVAPLNKNWVTDFEQGVQRAKEENKPILLTFVGLPWCPWSEKIDKEALSRLGFIEALKNDFVLVRMNLDEEGKNLKALRERFNIQKLPTILLLDSASSEIAHIGCLHKSPEAFADHVRQLYAAYEEIFQVMRAEDLSKLSSKELQHFYTKAKNGGFREFQEKLYLTGLKVDKGLFFLLEQYRHYIEKGKVSSNEAKALRKKIVARDPKNAQGGHRSLALVEFDHLASKSSRKKKDDKKVLEPLTNYLNKFGKMDGENVWRIELLIAQYFFGRDRPKEALIHAKSARVHAPEGQQGEIAHTIAYLESKMHPEANDDEVSPVPGGDSE